MWGSRKTSYDGLANNNNNKANLLPNLHVMSSLTLNDQINIAFCKWKQFEGDEQIRKVEKEDLNETFVCRGGGVPN